MKLCKSCNKEIKNPKWNQVYCKIECQKLDYDNKNQLRKKLNGCVICGFWRFVESHHIIKQIDWGSNTENNLINLCPNHHKMADSRRFGGEFLKLLQKKNGKIGEKLSEEEKQRVKNYIFYKLRENGWMDFNSGDISESSYGFRQEHRNLINQGIFYDIALKDKHQELNLNEDDGESKQ